METGKFIQEEINYETSKTMALSSLCILPWQRTSFFTDTGGILGVQSVGPSRVQLQTIQAQVLTATTGRVSMYTPQGKDLAGKFTTQSSAQQHKFT